MAECRSLGGGGRGRGGGGLLLPRRAVAGLWAALGAAALDGAAGAVAYLWPRRLRGTLDAGAAAGFAPGEVRSFHHEGVYVVRRPDGFAAFDHTCTHPVQLPCAVAWRPELTMEGGTREVRGVAKALPRATGWFRCPCHGATYDRADGDAAFGPGARSLDTFPVRLVAGRVQVLVAPGDRRRRELGAPPPVTPA